MTTSDPLIEIESLEKGITQVRLFGEVDAGVAEELQRSFAQLVRDGHTRLLVDLTNATFMDSTALGILLHTMRRLRRRRGKLAVACPNDAMRNLFELVGYNLLFPVDESVERAASHLRPRRRLRAPG
jgi:anti-sigma B factor antagonist